MNRLTDNTKLFLFIIFLSLLLTNCKNNKAYDEKPPSVRINSFSGFYDYLPQLILPYTWEENKYHFDNNYHELPKELYYLFGDSLVLSNVRIAKLPPIKSVKPILFYELANGNDSIDFYTLSDDLNKIDRHTVVSTKKLNDKSKITQTFIIIQQDRFKTFKLLNGTLIEQLNFAIDSTGVISEIRNGTLTTIAYETFQDSIYSVQSFKWDVNPIGGVYKKELKQRYYLLNHKGDVTEIKENEK